MNNDSSSEKRYAKFIDLDDDIVDLFEVEKFEWYGGGRTIKITACNGKVCFVPSDRVIITNFKF